MRRNKFSMPRRGKFPGRAKTFRNITGNSDKNRFDNADAIPVIVMSDGEDDGPIQRTRHSFVGRRESWIARASLMPRDENAIHVGPRKFQPWRPSRDDGAKKTAAAPLKTKEKRGSRPKKESPRPTEVVALESAEVAGLQKQLEEQKRVREELETKLKDCEHHRLEEERARREEDERRRRQKEDDEEARGNRLRADVEGLDRKLGNILQAVGGTQSSIAQLDGRLRMLETAVKKRPTNAVQQPHSRTPPINMFCLPPGFNLLRWVLPREPVVPTVHPFGKATRSADAFYARRQRRPSNESSDVAAPRPQGDVDNGIDAGFEDYIEDAGSVGAIEAQYGLEVDDGDEVSVKIRLSDAQRNESPVEFEEPKRPKDKKKYRRDQNRYDGAFTNGDNSDIDEDCDEPLGRRSGGNGDEDVRKGMKDIGKDDDYGHRNDDDNGQRNDDEIGQRNDDGNGHADDDDNGHTDDDDNGHTDDDNGHTDDDDNGHSDDDNGQRNDDDNGYRNDDDNGQRNDDVYGQNNHDNDQRKDDGNHSYSGDDVSLRIVDSVARKSSKKKKATPKNTVFNI